MIANIGSINLMWPRSGNAFAFRRRPYWSRLAAEATGQGCQFGIFESKFVIFGLFSTPLAFFIFEKRPDEIWLCLAILAN